MCFTAVSLCLQRFKARICHVTAMFYAFCILFLSRFKARICQVTDLSQSVLLLCFMPVVCFFFHVLKGDLSPRLITINCFMRFCMCVHPRCLRRYKVVYINVKCVLEFVACVWKYPIPCFHIQSVIPSSWCTYYRFVLISIDILILCNLLILLHSLLKCIIHTVCHTMVHITGMVCHIPCIYFLIHCFILCCIRLVE